MENLELKSALENLKAAATTLVEEKTAGMISKENFEKSMSELQAKLKENAEYAANLQAHVDAMEAKFKAENAPKNEKGFSEALYEIVSSPEFKANYKAKKAMEVELKAFDTKAMTTGSITNTYYRAIPTFGLPGVDRLSEKPFTVMSLVSTGTTANNRISWVEKVSKTDNTAFVGENATVSETEITWKDASVEVKKVMVKSKFTNEMIEDTDYVLSQIQLELLESLRNKIETDILTGTGAGSSPVGIIQYAKAFDAVTYGYSAGTIAHDADVYRSAITQVMEQSNGTYRPNAILISLSDFNNMSLQKDTDGNYVVPPFVGMNGETVAGVRIVPDYRITDGTFLVGDFTKAQLYFHRNINIKFFDQNDTDAEYDRQTVIATARLGLKVSTANAFAFVTGNLTDAKAALTGSASSAS